jgi:ubiquitin-conjugating enzyme E2 variant
MLWILALSRIALRITICFLLADLLVGTVHWAEDRYGSPDTPFIGASVIAPNLLHHEQPRAFLANSWWKSADLQVYAAGTVALLAALLGWFSWELALVLVLAVNGNEIHRWQHRTKAENGWLINGLQRTKLIQGRKHHARHHGNQRDTHYATITCWVNPLCEALHLWRGLERVVLRLTGVAPRSEFAGA